MLGIDAAQQFALIEPQAQGVIGLALAGRPGRLLARQHRRQAIEIGHDGAVDRLVEGEEPRLM